MSGNDNDPTQRPIPSPDATTWLNAGWDVAYQLGSKGYRPGLPNGEGYQPPTIKGG